MKNIGGVWGQGLINRGLGTRFINGGGGGLHKFLIAKLGSGSWGLVNREGFTNTNLSLQCSRVVKLHKTKDTATVQTKGKETEQMTGNAKKNKRTMTGKQDERTMKGLGPGT